MRRAAAWPRTWIVLGIVFVASIWVGAFDPSAHADGLQQTCVTRGYGAEVRLYAEARPDSRIAGSFPDGAKVDVLERIADRHGDPWLKVRHESLTGWLPGEAMSCRLSPDAARQAITDEAAAVISLLKDRDFAALARLVHPEKGVRLSPSAYVDTEQDVVLSADEVARLGTDQRVRVWGYEEGTGDAIEGRFTEYYTRYVYDRDYAEAAPTFNAFSAPTNTADNLFDVYPDAAVAEFYAPGADGNEADGSGLRLVFEPYRAGWFLSGLVHAQWTI